MINQLSENTILAPASQCTVRQHDQEYLVYNVKSDELHLIPQIGFFVYQLCDGITNIREIQEELQSRCVSTGGDLQERLYSYVDQLVERGILEIVGDV